MHKFGIVLADIWSATSYKELRRDALAVQRWNMLHPGKPKKPYITTLLENVRAGVNKVDRRHLENLGQMNLQRRLVFERLIVLL